MRILQSRYAFYFNQKYHRTGSLFRQRAKAKNCEAIFDNYRIVLFQYIHQNPEESGLIKDLADWDFSSYPDYFLGRKGSLINRDLAAELLGVYHGVPVV
jgi:hypothetical protein